MKPKQGRQLMEEKLGDELYRHCLGVAETAQTLANYYCVDTEKAYIAGMVHDYGKLYSTQELLQKAKELKLPLDRMTLCQEKLLHAPVGAALLKIELGIDDPEISGAVAYHTTGRVGMTLLEKIIYLADFIEPGRVFAGVETIRKAAENNLNSALLLSVNSSIKSILDRDLMLHPRSVAFRNSLLTEDKGR
jgi:predicted HD superfamily hydrolase involved in NAD metabolism